MGVAPLTIALGLQVLVSKQDMHPPDDTIKIPLNQKLRLPSGHFGQLKPVNQQDEKGVTVLAAVIDPGYQGKLGAILQ